MGDWHTVDWIAVKYRDRFQKVPSGLGSDKFFQIEEGGTFLLEVPHPRATGVVFLLLAMRGEIFHCVMPIYMLNIQEDMLNVPMLSQDGTHWLERHLEPRVRFRLTLNE